MITLAENLLLDKLKQNLIGEHCPTHMYGKAGNYLEGRVESILGIKIKKGLIDIVSAGISLEQKSRRDIAESSFTIGAIHQNVIINTENWFDTPIYKKMRKILLITTGGTERNKNDNVVKDIEIYDFSDKPEIQDMLEQAYRHSRNQIVLNAKNDSFIYCKYSGYLAYFERKGTKANGKYTNSWQFRFSTKKLQDLLTMNNSNFNNVLVYDV